ncbi:hypothetical protein AUL39_07945 [Tractidigestivibacter scatoligenes]|uniref:DNA-binding response regulator n=1 Tax=Tractidigestivibacter scatoligenes TaxID=1299998 RepID=A0A117J4L5_TRASO|nr:LytTR family DNA-binding domain-containing protein [Tractidigestivibacter scatoligenes]KUH58138.1 hypothetical protein AUL39_07945 [Tractidigestivibacter scatoligenes]
MYQVLLLEDSPAAAQSLLAHVRRYSREHDVELNVTWQDSARSLTELSEKADLILMDIEMPGLDGMEAATLLRTFDATTPIIFVTNLAQFAVRGYEVDALDFMVKPVSYGAFCMRMDKALRVMERNDSHSLVLKTQGGITVVRASEIAYINSRGHDLLFHLANGQTTSERGTLASVEERLPALQFVRVSKGTIVNMAQIKRYRSSEVTLLDGTTLTIGRTMRASVIEKVNTFFGTQGGAV